MRAVVSLRMQITRTDEHYQGSVTRVRDELRVPFSGLLELVAALERLTAPPDNPSPEDRREESTEERHA